MPIAVELMRVFYSLALLLELAGLAAFLATAVAFTWASGLSAVARLLAGCALASSAAAIVRYAAHLRALFSLPDGGPAGSAIDYADGWVGERDGCRATDAPRAPCAMADGARARGAGGRGCAPADDGGGSHCAGPVHAQLRPVDDVGLPHVERVRSVAEGGPHAPSSARAAAWPAAALDGAGEMACRGVSTPAMCRSSVGAGTRGGEARACARVERADDGVALDTLLLRTAAHGTRAVRAAVQGLRARARQRPADQRRVAYARMAAAGGGALGDGEDEGGGGFASRPPSADGALHGGDAELEVAVVEPPWGAHTGVRTSRDALALAEGVDAHASQRARVAVAAERGAMQPRAAPSRSGSESESGCAAATSCHGPGGALRAGQCAAPSTRAPVPGPSAGQG